uniref:Cytochrome c oxidase subunit 2 n=1 Tax=Biomphalaria glabrata TaxID=6526 RepID=Q6U1P0_BIOGL|nr:cytochrome c oxidase subunit II [Biomphalaria glabrata]AAQ74247.1 cytochrome c oxidase subunit II [Biomphalaria glabrata]AAQ75766.1 cytochrome c oxidase subunit II [Biomphalaria glabrata]AWK49500.1 cytochrome c oxidase subunit II [Biomphalaria glabrata]
MSYWGQKLLFDPASPIQEEMILFHDHAMVLLLGIFSFVAFLGSKLIMNKLSSRNMLEAQTLETIWTIIPALLLVWLAFPSLRLLYLLDEQSKADLILKSTGHQWYWSYEVPTSSFDSYMISGDYSLLEVDNRVTLPYNVNTTVVTTSADVLHAFTIPSVGMKMDSVPGRLNSMNMFLNWPGVYYGQCSEICGANHSFMPIVVEAVHVDDFFFESA